MAPLPRTNLIAYLFALSCAAALLYLGKIEVGIVTLLLGVAIPSPWQTPHPQLPTQNP